MATTINYGNGNKNILSANRNRRRLNKMAYSSVKNSKGVEKPKYLVPYLILAAGLIGIVIWQFINS